MSAAESGDFDVEAGGGAVWRSIGESTEVLLVYREQYDDWSFPKGKLKKKRAESHEDGALREVEEETGLKVVLGDELPTSVYSVPEGSKRVRYWSMTAAEPSAALVPDDPDEIAEVEWVTPQEAERRISHPGDHAVLAALMDAISSDFGSL